jgi:exodeoxyribonuclease V
MRDEIIYNNLCKNLGNTPTEDQSGALRKISWYICDNNNDVIFLMTGYAGTGKTSVISSVVKTLDLLRMRSVLLAPTGRAAKVLSSYSGRQAYTIHKKIYRQKSSRDGMGSFSLDRNLHKDTFFIVDEASMVSNASSDSSLFGSGRLLDDLIEYVYSGTDCKLILWAIRHSFPLLALLSARLLILPLLANMVSVLYPASSDRCSGRAKRQVCL